MPDITMCKGKGCPKKENCWRYRAIPTPNWQSYFVNSPWSEEKQECEHFLDLEKRQGFRVRHLEEIK